MRDRLGGMILAAAWAGDPDGQGLWSKELLSQSSPKACFDRTWREASGADTMQESVQQEGLATERVWRGLLHAAFCSALHEEVQGHHVHFWFSEHARAWLPSWAEESDGELRTQLKLLRGRLQDVFSLGINLRQRSKAELMASIAALRDDPEFHHPRTQGPPDALWEPSVAIAAAFWSGRNLPQAFAVMEHFEIDAMWLAALFGLLFGRRGMRVELEALGAKDWLGRLIEVEDQLKKEGRSVDDRVEELLS